MRNNIANWLDQEEPQNCPCGRPREEGYHNCANCGGG